MELTDTQWQEIGYIVTFLGTFGSIIFAAFYIIFNNVIDQWFVEFFDSFKSESIKKGVWYTDGKYIVKVKNIRDGYVQAKYIDLEIPRADLHITKLKFKHEWIEYEKNIKFR